MKPNFKKLSEGVFERQLQDARIIRPENLSKIRVIEDGIRVDRIHVVREIERFNTELNGLPFSNPEHSRETGRNGDESRPLNIIGRVAPSAAGWNRERRWVEPTIHALIRKV